MSSISPPQPKASTGISGLDDIVGGGLAERRVFLIEGTPGAGKTTVALQFLMEGARLGEKGLYITLSETDEELRAGAASHGWELGEAIDVFELVPPENLLDDRQQQSLLYSSDLELGETTQRIFEAIDRTQPRRLVLDSLSEIRLLSQSSLRYRRQILALKHYFARRAITVLLLDDMTSEAFDKTVHSIAHGVIRLEQSAGAYGAARRRLQIVKYRGQRFRTGYHDYIIRTGGISVFPRLVAAEHRADRPQPVLSSGLPELDQLLGGGVETGSSVLALGPAGAGKSLLVVQFIAAAIARGERAALFVFDEELGLLFQRTKSLGFDLKAFVDGGQLFVEQMDAAEVSPGEFAHEVRRRIERHDVRIVGIDSLNGYQNAMPEEGFIILHMHELLQYLNRQGVVTFLTVAQHGIVGDMQAPIDLTYLADTVILLRYFEANGRVRRAISVIKKRGSNHEDTIREYRIAAPGLQIGPPLEDFHGVLRGVPTYSGQNTLMK
jgi:circadian clock protein KaiC